MKISKDILEKNLVPSFINLIFWLTSYSISIILANRLNLESKIPFYYFLIPILWQLLCVFLVSLTQKKVFGQLSLFGLINYGAWASYYLGPDKLDSIVYLFGFIVAYSISTTINKLSTNIILFTFYILIGYLAFIFKGKGISQDEVFCLPILFGVYLIFPFINYNFLKLKSRLKRKTKDIKDILGNLDEGFLTFNKSGKIDEYVTESCKDILGVDPNNKNITDVLNLTEDQKNTFQKWIQNVWKSNLSFKDLIHFAPKSLEIDERFIKLTFRPIFFNGGNKIEKVILIADDKTKEKKLMDQLEKDKEEIKFISYCLKNPLEFVDLIDDSFNLLDSYKNIDSMESLYREFHTLKARFGQFGLKSLTKPINEVENVLSEKKFENKTELLDSVILSFQNHLKGFINKNRVIVETANKFIRSDDTVLLVSDLIKQRENFEDIDLFFNYLKENYLISDLREKFETYKNLVNELSKKEEKKIDFSITGEKILVNTQIYSKFIQSCIHLIRNMVDHGIETEEIRLEKGKNAKGKINIDFRLQGDNFIICFEDDGQGIDLEIIKKKAMVTETKKAQGFDLIFLEGVSTKSEASDLSGRGVGMGAVREEIRKLEGNIKVESNHKGTKFIVSLPIIDQ